MSEEPIKTEVFWEHPRWLHVIIPVGSGNEPLFVAYCPTCHTYVSDVIDWGAYRPGSGKINLPQYGCVGPE